jgi:uncharacterized protein
MKSNIDKSNNNFFESKSGFMTTHNGSRFDIFDPIPEAIDIKDIAHALSLLCRFGGHVKKFYSVAQHSVLVSWITPNEYALEALLHDATEAYCGDMIRPIKVFMPEFCNLEDKLEKAINKRFRLKSNKKCKKIIKTNDNIICATEARDLTSEEKQKFFDRSQYGTVGWDLTKPWTPAKSRKLFLELFYKLKEERDNVKPKRSS